MHIHKHEADAQLPACFMFGMIAVITEAAEKHACAAFYVLSRARCIDPVMRSFGPCELRTTFSQIYRRETLLE